MEVGTKFGIVLGPFEKFHSMPRFVFLEEPKPSFFVTKSKNCNYYHYVNNFSTGANFAKYQISQQIDSFVTKDLTLTMKLTQ